MLKTYVGPVESADNVSYLRPETAQAIFAQFKNVLEVSRQKVPFGIAQIGKALRNERDKLVAKARGIEAAIKVLAGIEPGRKPGRKTGRKLSAAAKRKISLAAKRRWKKIKSE